MAQGLQADHGPAVTATVSHGLREVLLCFSEPYVLHQ